ncbi:MULTISPECIES: MBG domain-containing protein [unclassified Pedobacter]|uniref:MBG domain-containing protein n=1 Tax=unclassified Pedobacter TaxID=2628915 RepID=UPI001DA48402|nr:MULTISPECIES: MBG domain-containing protein [unclassified Pedobacter]CAH0303949.1 hypothetical protein SRABI36_04742 [Pedobacter sp. Bi36]CAH0313111.1 hypothetical protein SRABI126_04864 [Pedobacter sp. Bi126]
MRLFNLLKGSLLIFLVFGLSLFCLAQTTYNFNAGATITTPSGSPWATQAVITIAGVNYKLTSGGNGGFSISATGGSGNSASLWKTGAGGDTFRLERADGQPFNFYSMYVRHEGYNSYNGQFGIVIPPWYIVTYNKVAGAAETDQDNSPIVGGSNAITTTTNTFTRTLAVNSVDIYFKANNGYWIDDIRVGIATGTEVAPTVSTTAATTIQTNSAVLGGNVTADGGATVTERGIVWSTSGVPTTSNNKVQNGSGTGSFSATISSLPAGTLINYRAYAINSEGTSYGANSPFTTLALPTITSAAYNASTGTLTVTGTGLQAKAGAANDVDISTLTLTAEGGSTYTLTSPDVEITSATAFSVTLNATDRSALGMIINKNGTTSTGGTVYNLTAANGWMANVSLNADATNAVTVSGVAVPAITSATYNGTTGVMVVSGTGFLIRSGALNDIDVTKLTVKGQGGATYTLTSAGVEVTSAQLFSVALNAADKAALVPVLNKNGLSAQDGNIYNLAAADDWNRGADPALTTADQTGNSIQATLPISLFPVTLPNPVYGAAYSQNVTASGGTGGYTFMLSAGSLPAGMSLSPAGVLSGTPSQAGIFNFTVQAADGNSVTGTRAYNIQIAAPTVVLNPVTLPDPVLTVAYSQQLSSTGGIAPYTYLVGAGALPAGLSLSSTGLISGTPTASGTFNFSIFSSDISPFNGVRAYSVTVAPAVITISPATLPDAVVGSAYSQSLSSTGGVLPYTYSITAGALPTGITLSAAGVLSGSATAAGSYSFTVKSTDASLGSKSQAYSINVAQADITISPATLPNPTLGAAYSQTFLSVGGTAPYTYSITAGAPPTGITLSAAGVLSGTATAPGSYTFTVKSTDAFSSNKSVSYTIAISALTISAPANFPVGLSTTYGTASATTSVTVSGTGLLAGITATPSSTTNFEVSADGTTFGPSAIIGSSGTVSGTVYVRLKATASAGTNLGNVILTSAGANSATINIPSSTVLKATLTYTSNAISKVYGASVPVLTGTVTGFVNSEIITTATTGTISWSSSATISSAVGSYNINGGGLTAANYNFVQAAANASALTVTPKPLTVSATGNNKLYDGTATATVTLSDDRVAGDVFTESYTGASFASAAVGINKPITVTGITISGGASGNYTLGNATASTTANISVRTITINPTVNSKIYGNVDPALNFTATPALATGDSFSGSLTRAAGENIGTYAITQGTLSAGSNYAITFTAGTNFTINKRAITVTATGQSKGYGNVDPFLTYTLGGSGLAFADTFSGSLSRAPGENVGSYAITQGTLALSTNYAITFTPGINFTINPRTVTVTATAQSKEYGSVDPFLTFTVGGSGLAFADTFSGSLSRLPGENAGDYAIIQGTLALSSNYALSYVGADFTIGKKTITVTAVAKSKSYGDADPALTYTFAPALVTGDSFSGFLSRSAGENVGTYPIDQGSLALNANYNLNYVGADFVIGKKIITVTASAKSKTYGDADPALTYTFSPTLVGTDTFTGALSRLPGENIGTYAINQGTLTLNSNYTLNYVGANLTIGKKTITVTAIAKSKIQGAADPVLTYTFAPALVTGDSFTGSLSRAAGETTGTYAITQGTLALNGNYMLTYIGANLTIEAKTVITVTAVAKSKTYGDADPALTYTFTPALQIGDSFTGSLSRAVGENVGTYAIGQGTLALDGKYTITYVGADLTIGKKTITVTAAAKNKAYGDADPALTYTFAPALQTGDSFTGSLSRAVGENIGTYAINQGTLALSNNYSIAFSSADLTIAKKTIMVTAAAKNKSYGDADPALTYTFAPALVTGDSFSGSLSRAAGENVGSYPINQGSLTLNANYTLNYIAANLVIAKKTITVTAAAKNKSYGDADPALTYTFAPALATGDSFSGSLSRVPGENVGIYPINQGSLALNANYILTYTGADLTIGKKTITVTAAAKSKTYGDADPALTYTFAPALGTGDSFSGSLSRVAGENVGVYAIVSSTLSAGANYTIDFKTADLTINKAVLSVTADAKQMCQGADLPVFTLSYNGFKFSDNANSLDTKPSVNSTGSRSSAAGDYVLSPIGGVSANYTFNYINGVFKINPLPLVTINSDKGTNISRGETAILTVTGAASYVWATASGILSGQNAASLTVRPKETTTYTVTATNSSGCSQSQAITLTVAENLSKIKANNILTPNNDGFNDKWVIENIDYYPNNEVKVFDKAGRIIYSKKAYDNSWDGTVNGTALSEGTYYYIVDFGTDKMRVKGFITLVREN